MENEKRLNTLIKEFLDERMEDIYSATVKKGENIYTISEYKKLSKKIYNDISKESLFEEYKKAEVDFYALQIEQAYIMGIKDTFKLVISNELL